MTSAFVGVLLAVFIGLCIMAGEARRQHDAAIFRRCDAHGGVFRSLRDGPDIVGVMCQDGLTPPR